MKRQRYPGDPYISTARFQSECRVCHNVIEPGTKIIIWPLMPRGHKAAHYTCSESDYLQSKAAIEDEAIFTGRY